MLWYRPSELQIVESKNFNKDMDILNNWEIESNSDRWIKLELFLLLSNMHDYIYLDKKHTINSKIADILLNKYYYPHLENKEMENYEWLEISKFLWNSVNNLTWEIRNNFSEERWQNFDKHIEEISQHLIKDINLKIEFELAEDILKVEWFEDKYFDLEKYKKDNGYE